MCTEPCLIRDGGDLSRIRRLIRCFLDQEKGAIFIRKGKRSLIRDVGGGDEEDKGKVFQEGSGKVVQEMIHPKPGTRDAEPGTREDPNPKP